MEAGLSSTTRPGVRLSPAHEGPQLPGGAAPGICYGRAMPPTTSAGTRDHRVFFPEHNGREATDPADLIEQGRPEKPWPSHDPGYDRHIEQSGLKS